MANKKLRFEGGAFFSIIEFYWSLGRDIVELQAESKWGSGFFNQLSLDLRKAFPNEIGFSVTNLKYMKRWYAFYSESITIRQRVGDDLVMPEIFGQIPRLPGGGYTQ